MSLLQPQTIDNNAYKTALSQERMKGKAIVRQGPISDDDIFTGYWAIAIWSVVLANVFIAAFEELTLVKSKYYSVLDKSRAYAGKEEEGEFADG